MMMGLLKVRPGHTEVRENMESDDLMCLGELFCHILKPLKVLLVGVGS